MSSLVETHGAEWLRMMLRIRLFEEELADLYKRGMLVGVVHLSIGQEATAVGVCSSLLPGDQITSTHRGHHHMLARGLDPNGCSPRSSAEQAATAAAREGRCT